MSNSKHVVAVIGGAVSGAEAAHQLTEKGIRTVVFDQNALPYGKIEDGLPKWHVKLRDKEEEKINTKLSHPLVSFVPNAQLGKNLSFEDLCRNWGFSAVLLAIGAWRDRPLPIDGIDAFVNKGLYYQNPFVYWFNHKHEPDYAGQRFDIVDGAAIVGGGLASLDVAKILMFETVQQALKERGHDVNLFQLDRSIAKVLDELGLTLADLGLKGCTIYYRRRVKDMPLSPMDKDTPEKLEKAQRIQEKILNNYKSKYLFNMAPCHVPVDQIVEDGKLAGIVFQETEIINGRVTPIKGSEKPVKAPLFISSIGSIPVVIEGIPMKGQVYQVDWDSDCRIEGFDNVFALGNAVTGRGNINESLKHGRSIAQSVIDTYLFEEATYEEGYRQAESATAEKMEKITATIKRLSPPSADQSAALEKRVAALQREAGYEGDFRKWVEQHLPTRLEHMIDASH